MSTLIPPRSAVPSPARPVGVPRARLAALDGLRLIAALMVVFHHYVGYGGGSHAGDSAWGKAAWVVFPRASWLGAYTWTGVELFFIISGFVICMSSWGRTLGDFFKSRVIRLFPAYWFAVLLTTLVVALWPVVRKPLHYQDVLVNLTMLQDAFGVTRVDAVYWTLWIELKFYLLFALVVYRGVTYRKVLAFCLLWTVASVAAAGSGDPLLNFVTMPQYSAYFIAGLAFYLMHRYRPNTLLWGVVLLSWGLAVHFTMAHQTEIAPDLGRRVALWPAVAMMTAAFVVMALLALGKLSWIRGGWLTAAGAVTYPLYLLHEHIGWTAIRLLRRHLHTSPWVLVGLVTAAMLVAAWLVHRLVERPVAPVLKRGLTRAFDDLHAARETDAPARA